MWTDGPKGLLLAMYMTTDKGNTLNGNPGKLSSYEASATLKLGKNDMASGILLGITAALRNQKDPTSPEGIMALSFNFMQMPSSTALAVDMPWINIDDLEFRCAAAGPVRRQGHGVRAVYRQCQALD
jgi:hypothetical protein